MDEESTTTARVDVVLPALDEEQALRWVLPRMPDGYRAIVVDNGSTDATASVARSLGAFVVAEPQRGFGAACYSGLLASTADVVAFCDADASFDPADLPAVCDPVLASLASNGSSVEPLLMLGARVASERGAWPIHARLANKFLARRLRRATSVQLTDLGPMRAAPRRDLLALDIADRRFGWPLEMVLRASHQRWTIGEVDVPYYPRVGRSKVTGTVRGTMRAVSDMGAVLRSLS